MSRMPLLALQNFVAAARLGNLTRAAEAANLTVSALSHQMRQLEQRLGYPLLLRQARGVKLTPEGQRLLDQVGPHLDAIGQAFQPFAARHDRVLTVSALPSMASNWLVPRLGHFVAAHPHIEINLESSERLTDFERQLQVDAALRVGAGQWTGLHAEPLFDEWLMPMASPALVQKMGGVDARPLSQWPLLGDPDGEWQRWFALVGDTAPTRYVAMLNDSESHHRAALDGIGVALGRVTRARLLLDSGQLIALSPQRLKTRWSHWLVYPPRSASHQGFLAFRAWLHAQASEHAQHMARLGQAAEG
ncbi:LysR substrate-binding domain-containing protein [Stenotrophomonas rhizophila]|uniref:LysR substrate-binding domain-containing protein n=1 Tax=Stenotrophomonas rhizophila TaxID=216778 RepID=UPI001E3CFD9E|nr:LysR substrate-binding domain-containing protein [Stenotrophomonas rhizophila]MCC7633849.1 LysR family transcriptional regulator [Stenotrophomonas rhizophila]MCC7665381.1 LysR family transcriptional regulator [Stenotrophomonas rhizophila]